MHLHFDQNGNAQTRRRHHPQHQRLYSASMKPDLVISSIKLRSQWSFSVTAPLYVFTAEKFLLAHVPISPLTNR